MDSAYKLNCTQRRLFSYTYKIYHSFHINYIVYFPIYVDAFHETTPPDSIMCIDVDFIQKTHSACLCVLIEERLDPRSSEAFECVFLVRVLFLLHTSLLLASHSAKYDSVVRMNGRKKLKAVELNKKARVRVEKD